MNTINVLKDFIFIAFMPYAKTFDKIYKYIFYLNAYFHAILYFSVQIHTNITEIDFKFSFHFYLIIYFQCMQYLYRNVITKYALLTKGTEYKLA